jgi:hypothetical protein
MTPEHINRHISMNYTDSRKRITMTPFIYPDGASQHKAIRTDDERACLQSGN